MFNLPIIFPVQNVRDQILKTHTSIEKTSLNRGFPKCVNERTPFPTVSGRFIIIVQ